MLGKHYFEQNKVNRCRRSFQFAAITDIEINQIYLTDLTLFLYHCIITSKLRFREVVVKAGVHEISAEFNN
jgi:hypothetical protein